jgi:glyoxylate utilization-related uncharacterized protein
MAGKDNIQVYNPAAFTARFMPSRALQALLKGDFNKFLIVRVEEMYRHVARPVPATRATIHICLYLTEGEATMKIGSEQYTIRRHEMLVVPAGHFRLAKRMSTKAISVSFMATCWWANMASSPC